MLNQTMGYLNCLRAGLAPQPSSSIALYTVEYNVIFDEMCKYISKKIDGDPNNKVVVMSHQFGSGKTTFVNFLTYMLLKGNNSHLLLNKNINRENAILVSYIQFGRTLIARTPVSLYREIIRGLTKLSNDNIYSGFGIFIQYLKNFISNIDFDDSGMINVPEIKSPIVKFFLTTYKMVLLELNTLLNTQNTNTTTEISDLLYNEWIITRWLMGFRIVNSQLRKVKELFTKLREKHIKNKPAIPEQINNIASNNEIKSLFTMLSKVLIYNSCYGLFVIIDEFEGILKEAVGKRKHTIEILKTVQYFYKNILTNFWTESTNFRLYLFVATTPALEIYMNNDMFRDLLAITCKDNNIVLKNIKNVISEIKKNGTFEEKYKIIEQNFREVEVVLREFKTFKSIVSQISSFIDNWITIKKNAKCRIFQQKPMCDDKNKDSFGFKLVRTIFNAYKEAYRPFGVPAIFNALIVNNKINYSSIDSFNNGILDAFCKMGEINQHPRFLVKYTLKTLDKLFLESKSYLDKSYIVAYGDREYNLLKLTLLPFSEVIYNDRSLRQIWKSDTIMSQETMNLVRACTHYETLKKNDLQKLSITSLFTEKCFFSTIMYLSTLFDINDILWGIRFHALISDRRTSDSVVITPGAYVIYSNSLSHVKALIYGTGLLYQVIKSRDSKYYLITEIDLSSLKETYGYTLASFASIVPAIIDNISEVVIRGVRPSSASSSDSSNNDLNWGVYETNYNNDPTEFLFSLFKDFYKNHEDLLNQLLRGPHLQKYFELERNNFMLYSLRSYCSYSFDFFRAFSLYTIKRIELEKRINDADKETSNESELETEIAYLLNNLHIAKQCFNDFLLKKKIRKNIDNRLSPSDRRKKTIEMRRSVEHFLGVPIIGTFSGRESEDLLGFLDKLLESTKKRLVVIIHGLDKFLSKFSRQQSIILQSLDNLRRILDGIGTRYRNISFIVVINKESKVLGCVKRQYEAVFQRLSDVDLNEETFRDLHISMEDRISWEFFRDLKINFKKMDKISYKKLELFFSELKAVLNNITTEFNKQGTEFMRLEVTEYIKLVTYVTVLINLLYSELEIDELGNNLKDIISEVPKELIKLQNNLWSQFYSFVSEGNVTYENGKIKIKGTTNGQKDNTKLYLNIPLQIKSQIEEGISKAIETVDIVVNRINEKHRKLSIIQIPRPLSLTKNKKVMDFVHQIIFSTDTGLIVDTFPREGDITKLDLTSGAFTAIDTVFHEAIEQNVKRVVLTGSMIVIIEKEVKINDVRVKMFYQTKSTNISENVISLINKKLDSFFDEFITYAKDNIRPLGITRLSDEEYRALKNKLYSLTI